MIVRRLFIVAVLVALGGCGGAGGGGATTTTTAATSSTVAAAWIDQFMPGPTPAEPANGHPVWVNEGERTVYVEDCATARQITADGGRYGPGPRDPETLESKPGYAYVCKA